MKRFSSFFIYLGLSLSLSSCEFHCSVGDKKEAAADAKSGQPVVKDGARIYNGIQLETHTVKLDKAFLRLEDGNRVEENNFVDFTQPVRMQMMIDSGWTEQGGKVWLGASEKITDERGNTILEEADLFKDYPAGITAEDAHLIYLSANIRLKEKAAPATFMVSFRIWDKKGEGWVQGNYKLYSK